MKKCIICGGWKTDTGHPLGTINPCSCGEKGEVHTRPHAPETSHQSAREFEGAKAKKAEAKILGAIDVSSAGLACFEIMAQTGQSHQTVSGRFTTLKEQGKIKDSGRRRKNPRSGRNQIVWIRGNGVALPPAGKHCAWIEDEMGCWDAACGQSFEFYAEGPKENKFKFCPYCGKRIKL